MDDSSLVDGGERMHELVRDRHDLLERELPTRAEPALLERLALEEVQDEVHRAVALAVGVHVHDRAMAHGARDVRLPEEALNHGLVGAQGRVQDLDRAPGARPVRRLVHGRRRAPAEEPLEPPRASDDRAHPLVVFRPALRHGRIRSIERAYPSGRHPAPGIRPPAPGIRALLHPAFAPSCTGIRALPHPAFAWAGRVR